MKARLYWTIQHTKRGVQDLRFHVKCWWLSQHVDFLEWRWRIDRLMVQPQPVPIPIQSQQGGRYAVHSM